MSTQGSFKKLNSLYRSFKNLKKPRIRKPQIQNFPTKQVFKKCPVKHQPDKFKNVNWLTFVENLQKKDMESNKSNIYYRKQKKTPRGPSIPSARRLTKAKSPKNSSLTQRDKFMTTQTRRFFHEQR